MEVSDDICDSLNTSNASSEESMSIKKRKLSKKNTNQADILLNKAIESLSKEEDDEDDNNPDAIFGKYIGKSISEIKDNVIKCTVKNRIQNIIFEGQMAQFNQQNPQFQNSQMPYYQQQYQPQQHQQQQPTPSCYNQFDFQNMNQDTQYSLTSL